MDVMTYVMNTSEVNPNVLRTVLNEEIEKNSGMKIDDLDLIWMLKRCQVVIAASFI